MADTPNEEMVHTHISLPKSLDRELRALCTHKGDYTQIIRGVLKAFIDKKKAKVNSKGKGGKADDVKEDSGVGTQDS